MYTKARLTSREFREFLQASDRSQLPACFMQQCGTVGLLADFAFGGKDMESNASSSQPDPLPHKKYHPYDMWLYYIIRVGFVWVLCNKLCAQTYYHQKRYYPFIRHLSLKSEPGNLSCFQIRLHGRCVNIRSAICSESEPGSFRCFVKKDFLLHIV